MSHKSMCGVPLDTSKVINVLKEVGPSNFIRYVH